MRTYNRVRVGVGRQPEVVRDEERARRDDAEWPMRGRASRVLSIATKASHQARERMQSHAAGRVADNAVVVVAVADNVQDALEHVRRAKL